MTINLEKFVSEKEVLVTFRDGTAAKGRLERREFATSYPYLFRFRHYSVKGEIWIDKRDIKDILDIQFVKDPPMNVYRELADKLYHALKITERKAGICYNEAEEAKREYESLQPEMTKYGCGTYSGEMVVYGEKIYALFYGNWYALHGNKIYIVEDNFLVTKLDSAYEIYKKNK